MLVELELNIRKRDKFFELQNNDSRTRIKKFFFVNYLFYLNIFFKSYGLKINKLELTEYNGEFEQIDQTNQAINNSYEDFKNVFVIRRENININEDEELFIIQSARDIINMSEKAYTSFKNKISPVFSKKLHSLKKINVFKKKLNEFFKVKCDNIKNGVYVKPIDKIKFVLKKIYIKLNKNIKNNVFCLHLSGDGLQIAKTNVNLINLTFKVLNENNDSPKGLYTLGKFEFIVCCFLRFMIQISKIDKYKQY